MKNSPFALVLALLLTVVALLPKGSYSAPTRSTSVSEYKASDAEEAKKLLEENKAILTRLDYYRHGIKRMLDLEKALLDRIRDTVTILSIDKTRSDKLNALDIKHIRSYNGIKETLENKFKVARDIRDLLREKIKILQGGKLSHGVSDYVLNHCQCDKESSSLKCKITIKKLISIDNEYLKHHAFVHHKLEELDKFSCDLIQNIKRFMILSYNLYKEYERNLSKSDLTALHKKYGHLVNPFNLKTCDDLNKTLANHTQEQKKPTSIEASDSRKENESESKAIDGPSTSRVLSPDDAGSEVKKPVSIPIPPPLPNLFFGKSHQDLLHKKFNTLSSELNDRFKNRTKGTTLVSGKDKTPSQDGEVAPKEHSTEPLILGNDHSTVVEHKKEESASEEKHEAPVTLQKTNHDDIDATENGTLMPLEEDQLPEVTEEVVETRFVLVNKNTPPEVAAVTPPSEGTESPKPRSTTPSRSFKNVKLQKRDEAPQQTITPEVSYVTPQAEEGSVAIPLPFKSGSPVVDEPDDEEYSSTRFSTPETIFVTPPSEGEYVAIPQPAESGSPVVNQPEYEEASTEKIGSESSVSLGSDIEFVDDDDAELEEPELVQHNDVGGEDAPNRQGSASNESSHGDESSLLNRSELSEVTDSELDPANAGSFPNPATIAMTALSNFATGKVLPFISRLKNRFVKPFIGGDPVVKNRETSVNETEDEFDPSERFYTPPESRSDYESVHSSEKLDKSLSKLDENAHSVWKDENLANDSHSVNELGSNSTSPPTTPATLVEDTKEHKPVEPENPPKEKTVYKNREVRKTHANELINKLTNLRNSCPTDTEKPGAPKETKQYTESPKEKKQSTEDEKDKKQSTEVPIQKKQSTEDEKEETNLADKGKTIIKLSLVKSELVGDGFVPSSLLLLALVSIYNIIN